MGISRFRKIDLPRALEFFVAARILASMSASSVRDWERLECERKYTASVLDFALLARDPRWTSRPKRAKHSLTNWVPLMRSDLVRKMKAALSAYKSSLWSRLVPDF
eukprot:scaffold2037_cov247-Chaetoceros_neogracile.AAC.6